MKLEVCLVIKMNENQRKGYRVYVDPFYFQDTFYDYIEPLSLLADEIFVYDPTDWLSSENYSQSKFKDFVEEEIFIPIYNEPPDYEVPLYLTRAGIIGDGDFFYVYNEHLRDDFENDELNRFIKTVLPNQSKYSAEDIVFSMDWDMIVSQALNANSLITSELKPLWELKFSKIFSDGKTIAMRDFLINYTLKIPKDFTIDQIKNLRKDTASKGLRKWFETTYNKISTLEYHEDVDMNGGEILLREFQEMLYVEDRRTQNFSKYGAAISSILITIVGLSVDPAASIAGPMLNLPVSSLIDRIYKKFGKNNWTFLLADIKNSR
jgi:hypothetical protein